MRKFVSGGYVKPGSGAKIWIGADNGQWFEIGNALTNIQFTMKEEEVTDYNDLKPGDVVSLMGKDGGSATVKVAKIASGILIVSEEGTAFGRSKWDIVKVVSALAPEPKVGSVVRISKGNEYELLIVRTPEGWRDLIDGRVQGGAYSWKRMNEIWHNSTLKEV